MNRETHWVQTEPNCMTVLHFQIDIRDGQIAKWGSVATKAENGVTQPENTTGSSEGRRVLLYSRVVGPTKKPQWIGADTGEDSR